MKIKKYKIKEIQTENDAIENYQNSIERYASGEITRYGHKCFREQSELYVQELVEEKVYRLFKILKNRSMTERK